MSNASTAPHEGDAGDLRQGGRGEEPVEGLARLKGIRNRVIEEMQRTLEAFDQQKQGVEKVAFDLQKRMETSKRRLNKHVQLLEQGLQLTKSTIVAHQQKNNPDA